MRSEQREHLTFSVSRFSGSIFTCAAKLSFFLSNFLIIFWYISVFLSRSIVQYLNIRFYSQQSHGKLIAAKVFFKPFYLAIS